jgi:hypothetical protein
VYLSESLLLLSHERLLDAIIFYVTAFSWRKTCFHFS